MPTTTRSSTDKTTTLSNEPAGGSTAGRLVCVFAALLLTVGACTGSETPPEIVEADVPETLDVQGHRGARGLRPENTLAAFEIALDLGVTTLELDLHFSADGVPVVWHDPIVDPSKCRLADGAPSRVPDPETADSADLGVRRLTAEQLGWYVCDRNPDPGRFPDQMAIPGELPGADFRIIPLAELFAFVEAYAASDLKSDPQREAASQVHFNIETKRVPAEPETIDDGFDGSTAGPFELAILAVVAAAGLDERVVVQSFDHRSLRAVAATGATVQLAPLTRDRVNDPAAYVEWGADIWSPSASTLTAELLASAQAAGLAVVPWTVNDPADMAALIDLGVDGIITDRPDLLLERP